MLRSQAGPGAGAWLRAIPSDANTTFTPQHFILALRRRLRLRLPLTGARCGQDAGTRGCGGRLDAYGDHMAACPRTGALPRRGHLLEQAWIQVCREASDRTVASSRSNGSQLPGTTAQGVSVADRRRLDLVVYGVSPWAKLCASTSPWWRRLRGQAAPARGLPTPTAPRSPRRATASTHAIRGCYNLAHTGSLSWPVRLGGDGVRNATAFSGGAAGGRS